MITIHKPTKNESLDEYIDRHDIKHFSARETRRIRSLGILAPEPKRAWWPRIIPTLHLAERLRALIGVPLSVGNGYRPFQLNAHVGGALFSQHIYYRALDLDLPRERRPRSIQEDFYEAACTLFLMHGKEYKIGLGLYRSWHGSRVHIDAGKRKRYWKKKYVKPLLESMR